MKPQDRQNTLFSLSKFIQDNFKKIVKLRSLKSDLIEKELLHSDVH